MTTTSITKNLTDTETIERGYHLLTTSLDSPEFHRFVSSQLDQDDDGPEAA